jgi:hypothetical protein
MCDSFCSDLYLQNNMKHYTVTDSLRINWVVRWTTRLHSLRLRKSLASDFTHYNTRTWKMVPSYINKTNMWTSNTNRETEQNRSHKLQCKSNTWRHLLGMSITQRDCYWLWHTRVNATLDQTLCQPCEPITKASNWIAEANKGRWIKLKIIDHTSQSMNQINLWNALLNTSSTWTAWIDRVKLIAYTPLLCCQAMDREWARKTRPRWSHSHFTFGRYVQER